MRQDHALSLTRRSSILQNRVVRNESVSDPVRALLRTRRTLLADVDLGEDAPERVLVRSDVSGTMQLYELGSGDLVELTSLPEPVASAHYVPGARRAVLAVDEGGNERHQLYLIDLDDAAAATVAGLDRLRALTSDPRFGHQFAGVSPDGQMLAYVSDRSNGVDFDLWLCDLKGAEHRLLYAGGAWCQPASGFSPGGRFVSVLRRARDHWTWIWCSSTPPPVKRGSRFRILARRRWSGRQRG